MSATSRIASGFLATIHPLQDVRWTDSLPDRFWSKVVKRPSGCWEYSGKQRKVGSYGLFHLPVTSPRGPAWRMESASRIAYEMATGERLGPDEEARHACDNPPCVRPDHLLRGTAMENSADKIARGRCTNGERVHSSKLTAEQVLSIRQRYAAGEDLITELAAEFGVRWNTIEGIVHGREWRHLGGPRMDTTGRTGERHPDAKLTEAQVEEIRARLAADPLISQAMLGREFGITRQAVRAIVRGKTWAHVGGPRLSGARPGVGPRAACAKLTAKIVRAMRRTYDAGRATLDELAEKYGIKPSTVSAIVRREAWKHVPDANPPKQLRHRPPALAAEQVTDIRARHAGGERSASLARAFGVSPATISHVVRRKTFRGLP